MPLDICDENFVQECFFLPKLYLKCQRTTFSATDDFEIVYYQWEGFLSSERLNEGFRIVLEFISFIP